MFQYFERYHNLIFKLQHYGQPRPYHFNDIRTVNTNVTFELIKQGFSAESKFGDFALHSC